MNVDTATIEQLVHDRVVTLTKGNVPVYDGVIPQTPPTISAQDPRVLPYIAWWGGADDRQTSAEPLDPTGRDDVTWTGRLTVAAGAVEHLSPVVQAMTSGLHLWPIPLDNASTSLLRVAYLSERRIDRAETPSRLYRLLELSARAGA